MYNYIHIPKTNIVLIPIINVIYLIGIKSNVMFFFCIN